MNKAELIEYVAKATKSSKEAAKTSVEAFVKGISDSLKKGNSVVLTGFGTFDVSQRKARVGVNPATGKKMQIAAKKVVKFRPGKALKDLVNNK